MKKLTVLMLLMSTSLFGGNNFDNDDFNAFYSTWKNKLDYTQTLRRSMDKAKEIHPELCDIEKRKAFVKLCMDVYEENCLRDYLDIQIEHLTENQKNKK